MYLEWPKPLLKGEFPRSRCVNCELSGFYEIQIHSMEPTLEGEFWMGVRHGPVHSAQILPWFSGRRQTNVSLRSCLHNLNNRGFQKLARCQWNRIGWKSRHKMFPCKLVSGHAFFSLKAHLPIHVILNFQIYLSRWTKWLEIASISKFTYHSPSCSRPNKSRSTIAARAPCITPTGCKTFLIFRAGYGGKLVCAAKARHQSVSVFLRSDSCSLVVFVCQVRSVQEKRKPLQVGFYSFTENLIRNLQTCGERAKSGISAHSVSRTRKWMPVEIISPRKDGCFQLSKSCGIQTHNDTEQNML